MKILVTGGNGMVGKSLQRHVDKMHEHGFIFLTMKDGDLRDFEDVSRIFLAESPDVVIHLASKVGGVYDNINANYTYLMDNIKINCNIVEACKRYNVKRLINILSTCVFPDINVIYPLTSDQLHNGAPHESNKGYAYSKRILQVSSMLLAQDTETKVVNLIPTNLYGENDNFNLTSAHVLPALIHRTYLCKLHKTDLKVLGTGNATRQFLYVDDLSKIIISFIDMSLKDANDISCIVSPPESEEISIRDLVAKITFIMGYSGAVNFDNVSNDGQLKKTVSSTELKVWLPNFQFTSSSNGLSKTIDFFNNTYPNVRH